MLLDRLDSYLFLLAGLYECAYFIPCYHFMKRSGAVLKRSPCQQGEVAYITFNALSRLDIQTFSVAQITEPYIYQADRPMRGGPNDLRLGVCTMEYVCETCGESRDCQGHFGHIKLAETIFHYGYMGFIEKILKCICHNCGKLKVVSSEEKKEKFLLAQRIARPQKRLSELAKVLGSIHSCAALENGPGGGCGGQIPTKISLKDYKITVDNNERDGVHRAILTAQWVKNLFEKITPQDARMLGFTVTRPEDLVIEVLAVAPPQVRPPVQVAPDKKAEDDITNTYRRIILVNNELKENVDSVYRNETILELERLVASIMVDIDPMALSPFLAKKWRNKSTLKIKSIEERLQSKEGRFRQHLMGKRVDFSARSVISPDPNIQLDQLGVPEKIANALTIPEQVTEWNYDRMMKLCLEGRVKFILRPTQDRRSYEDFILMSKVTKSEEEIRKFLSYGTIVERVLQNGDYVLFNRQPTLHRMSMMAHRVRILPQNTFRLNLSVCTPYNADFDGDQMNMHVPQSVESLAELKHIAHVPKQIIAPKNNAPVMGIVQDALLGIYLMTSRDTFLTRDQVMNLLMWVEPLIKFENGDLPQPTIQKPQCLWTGKQVISMLIPKEIALFKKQEDSYRNIYDNTVLIIREGEIVTGILQKEVVGTGYGGLVHGIWLELGEEATCHFINNVQRVVNNWLMHRGFSVGTCDIVTDARLEEKRQQLLGKIKKNYYKTLNSFRSESDNKMYEKLHQPGRSIMDTMEFKINQDLNMNLTLMQRVVKEAVNPQQNNIAKMIEAKSKGSETNLAQIMGCLGNQNVNGQRCPLGFSKRAMPHFSKYDNSPEPRGFVFSSFYQGLKPHEFFYHSMGGREGLSDTAVKTSSIGYLQRKLVKALEDLSIRYDGTVRDAQANILQPVYGQDGFLAEFIEHHRGYEAESDEKSFMKKHQWEAEQKDGLLKTKYNFQEQDYTKIQHQLELLLDARTAMRKLLVNDRDTKQVEYYSPINFDRLLTKLFGPNKCVRRPIQRRASPKTVVNQLQKLLHECVVPKYQHAYREHYESFGKKNLEKYISSLKDLDESSGQLIFHLHLRLQFSSKTIFEQFQFSLEEFQTLMKEIKKRYRKALAPAGEAVGAVAAQSVGQPTTQMTLNTFHLAGVADKNVTLGIPRLRELLDCTQKIKTPSMKIFYQKKLIERQMNRDELVEVLSWLLSYELPQRHMGDFIQSTSIIFDPDPENSHIGLSCYDFADRMKSPWVLYLFFDRAKISNLLVWRSIQAKLQEELGQQFYFTQQVGFGEQMDPQLALRAYSETVEAVRQGKFYDSKNFYTFMCTTQQAVRELDVGGLRGIKTIRISKKMTPTIKSGPKLSDINWQNFEEYYFECDGSNLKACLSHYAIDHKRTTSNDIREVCNVLGIEAARQTFLNEFQQILKPYNIYVNHRHLNLLADWMTVRGHLTPVNRNGINRVKDISVLRKASFEETGAMLFGAAVFSEVDYLRGVSERIIFGETVQLGTNCFQVNLDLEKAKNYQYKGSRDHKGIAEDPRYDNRMRANMPISRTPVMDETPRPNASVMSGMSSPYQRFTNSPGFTPGDSYFNPDSPSYNNPLAFDFAKSVQNRFSSPSYHPQQYPSSTIIKREMESSVNRQHYGPVHHQTPTYFQGSIPQESSSYYQGMNPISKLQQISSSPSYNPVMKRDDHNGSSSPQYTARIEEKPPKAEEYIDSQDEADEW